MLPGQLPPDSPLKKTYDALYAILFGPAAYNQGNWDASTNTPTLTSGVGKPGQYYVCSVAGSTVLDGITTEAVDDKIAFDGIEWVKNPVNALADYVLPGNRIDFGLNDDNPVKDTVATVDLPEVQLIYEGASDFNPHVNSSNAQFIMNIGLYVNSGDIRNQFITALDWYVLANLCKWRDHMTAYVTWNGEPILKNFVAANVLTGLSDPNRNRNIKGWTSCWRFQLTIIVSNVNLTYTES